MVLPGLIFISVLLSPPCENGQDLVSAVIDLAQQEVAGDPPVYGYKIIREISHDPHAFTQGLLFHDGALYESTGLFGQSSIRRLDLETGRATQSVPIDSKLFAEGLALDKDGRLVQLTWKSGRVLTWDPRTLEPVGTARSIKTEGWGITSDGTNLLQSDGSSKIYVRDPVTLAVVRTIDVKAAGQPVTMLNELEYINGEIWANVWMTDRIARISPTTGQVVGWIDLTGLRRGLKIPDGEQNRVLNGIAYDPATKRLWVGGKQWPTIYQIELVPPKPGS